MRMKPMVGLQKSVLKRARLVCCEAACDAPLRWHLQASLDVLCLERRWAHVALEALEASALVVKSVPFEQRWVAGHGDLLISHYE